VGEPEFPTSDGHRVVVNNRETVNISGVVHVESYDDQVIVLETELGTLNIQGEELNIKQLNLEQGSLTVEGLVTGLTYTGERGRGGRGRGRGFFDRIFR